MPAVVAALELDELLVAGRRARQPHGVERRLGAREREQDPLERGHHLDELLRQLDLDVGDADAHDVDPASGLGERAVDTRVGMTQDLRPERRVIVRVDPSALVGERRP